MSNTGFRSVRRLSSLGLLGAAFAATGVVEAQTKVWTTNADFDLGSSTNVQHKPADTVVLGPTPVSKTTIVWADNYNYGHVVRIDSVTGKQTARFDSALVTINGQATGARPANEYCNWANTGNCPGRITTDANGDVWIVNRAFGTQGTLSKFSGDLAHCIDRNGNGKIETSIDKNGDGKIDMAPAAGEYFGQGDECIITTIPVGPPNMYPRAVAVDKRGKIWACTHQDGMCYRFNPNDPVVLETSVKVGGNPYSAATGGDYLYVSSSSGPTRRVHITSLAMSTAPCPGTYGIVGDPSGNVAYLGYCGSGGMLRADFANNTCKQTVTTGSCSTATTLDLQGFVWLANYSSNSVTKMTSAGIVVGTYPAGGTSPHGISVDFQGNIWTVNDGTASMGKINSATGALIGSYSLGGPSLVSATPYLYSDFTGVQLDRQAPYTYLGSWEGTFDGGVPAVPWSRVKWNAEAQGAVPAETTLVLAARAADSMAALGQAAYTLVMNGGVLSGVKGRYVEVRADLKGPGFATAVLSDVKVTGPCDPLSDGCCVKDADCDDGSVCTADKCPIPGGSCVHVAVAGCCQNDADCDDKNQCTTDACPVAGGQCQHVQKADCCMSSNDCSDGDACTADVCPSPGGQCLFVPIKGCCTQDIDCTKGDKCSAATCVGGFCQDAKKPNCCVQDTDCSDKDLCTADSCDVANGTCNHEVQAGCCNVSGQCDDGNACTHDDCSGPGGVCVHTSIAGCCTDKDPQNGTACDLPESPNDHPPCKAGQWLCKNGSFVCEGAVKPVMEACNNKDDDCDGLVDNNSCAEGLVCIEGVCAKPCQGEAGCLGGFQCFQGYCVPKDCAKVTCKDGEVCKDGLCSSADGGAAGGMGSGGQAAGLGGSGTGGDSTTSSSGGSSTGTDTKPAPAGGAGPSRDVWGLATGGACRCAVPGEGGSRRAGGAGFVLAGLALALSAARRRGGAGARGGILGRVGRRG